MYSDLLQLILHYLPSNVLVKLNYNDSNFWQSIIKRDFGVIDKVATKIEYLTYVNKVNRVIDIIDYFFDYVKTELNNIKYGKSLDEVCGHFWYHLCMKYGISNDSHGLSNQNMVCFNIIFENKTIKIVSSDDDPLDNLIISMTREILLLNIDINLLIINSIKHLVGNTYQISLQYKN